MTSPDSLNVWYENELVGNIWRNQQGLIGFRYNEDWLNQNKFAVSLKLPLQSEDYPAEEGGIAHRFFANLLPEAGVRDQVVRDLKIPNTDFDLLRAIGGECAGAFSLLPVEREPDLDNRYNKLDDEKLIQLIRRRGQILIAKRENEELPRLSLAGAQNKCPVLIKGDDYYLPVIEAPTSHILKFEIPDYSNIPAYETYNTLLAVKVGLPAVDIELRQLKNHYYMVIRRYDRFEDNKGNIIRLHQEDFCQALGYSYNNKYEDEQGPSFADCYRLVRDNSSDPTTDTENLLKWIIFNYIAGNSDGHAKNLSFLYKENGEIRLAPFYDLVCTRAIERINTRLAFGIGGNTDPGHITKKNWVALAKDCDVGSRYILNLLRQTTEQISDNVAVARESFESKFGNYPALQRIGQVIHEQRRLVLASLTT